MGKPISVAPCIFIERPYTAEMLAESAIELAMGFPELGFHILALRKLEIQEYNGIAVDTVA